MSRSHITAKRHIVQLLVEMHPTPVYTTTIYHYLCDKLRYAPTRKELVNYLSKDKDFTKVEEAVQHISSATWRLT